MTRALERRAGETMHSMLPLEFEYAGRIPDLLYGYVSVNSQGGNSAFSPSTEQWPTSTEAFVARAEDHQQARRALEGMGFMVLAESPLGIAVAGAPGAFEELTAGTIIRREVLMYA